jgi:hypothetical protein
MKTTIFGALLAAILIGAGCVRTVDGHRTAAVPFVKDTATSYYERSVDQVFEATKTVLRSTGTLANESTIHNATNTIRTVEGKVNKVTVWVRIWQEQPKISGVLIQTRTSAGTPDVAMAHQVDKQIALQLAR